MRLAFLSQILQRGWEATSNLRDSLAPVVASTGECVAVVDLFGGARGLALASFAFGFLLASALCCGRCHGR